MTLSKLTDASTQNGQSELASKVGMTLETAVRALYWSGFILPSIKAISDSYHISLKTSAVYAAFGHPPSPWHYMWHEQYKLCAMTYKICLFRTAEMDSLTAVCSAKEKKKREKSLSTWYHIVLGQLYNYSYFQLLWNTEATINTDIIACTLTYRKIWTRNVLWLMHCLTI